MDLGEEAKRLWPISSVFSAPLLLSDENSDNESRKIGPLLFNPCHKTLTISPSLYSPNHSFYPPYPRLSLSTFLHSSADSLILPSTSSSIASSFTFDNNQSPLPHNSLHMMECSASHRLLLFFLVGNNLDQVGFILLSVQGGQVRVKFTGATKALNHRISNLFVQKVDDSSSADFGFVLVSTTYSVYWYDVRLALNSDTPKLELLETKHFRTSVVDACWSPHLPEECVVLLENGMLFLFDLVSFCSGCESLMNNFKRKNVVVRWEDYLDVQVEGSWLSCQFSWHPRILIVAHSSAIFLVDLRSEGCKVECLLRISVLAAGSYVQENDRFVAFSRAGPDGFYYTVASNSLLFLCDVRKPLKPVLQWNHTIQNPAYITVVKLSNLRSNSKNDEYTWASENGHCILLGSFWNCEFSLFCYGPNTRTCAASEISRFCKSFYAWELPSELLLASGDCYCRNCLLREEFSKDALPEWIHWQQKKEIVLGFCILDEALSVQLFEPENYGSFTVIRIMSSGSLELERYFASREAVNFFDKPHNEPSIILKESLIYGTGDEEHKFSKKLPVLKLDKIYKHMDELEEVPVNELKERCGNPPEGSSNPEISSDEPDFRKPKAIDAICHTGLKFDAEAIGQLPAKFRYLFGQHKKFKNNFST